jgi:hypothetical protein
VKNGGVGYSCTCAGQPGGRKGVGLGEGFGHAYFHEGLKRKAAARGHFQKDKGLGDARVWRCWTPREAYHNRPVEGKEPRAEEVKAPLEGGRPLSPSSFSCSGSRGTVREEREKEGKGTTGGGGGKRRRMGRARRTDHLSLPFLPRDGDAAAAALPPALPETAAVLP